VQIFEAFWNTNFATAFTGGQNSSSPVNLSGAAATGAAASGTTQYVVGTFVADSDTEPLSQFNHRVRDLRCHPSSRYGRTECSEPANQLIHSALRPTAGGDSGATAASVVL